MVFKENESYMHKTAKEVVKEWFDTTEKHNDYVQLGDIYFRPNRSSGVLLEYPVTNDSIKNIWDERVCNNHPGYWNDYVPTYDECLYKFKKIPKAVLDIACIHTGQVYLGIEVNHKHKVPNRKIELFKKNLGLQELIEINASWVMNQIKKPDQLKYQRLI